MFYDWFGALTSLLSTYFFIRLDAKAWLVSLVAITVNALLYWEKGIYAEMGLEGFYFLSTCYGWYIWSKKHPEKEQAYPVQWLTLMQWTYLILSSSIVFICLFLVLTKLHSNIASLDALTTTLSIVAQLLMCYKIIATWIIWFIADSLYALLYWKKDLPFHTASMILYMGFAVIGYFSWIKKSRQYIKQKISLGKALS